jgi:glycerol-3-phosphate acyltransferase PlsY
VHLVGSYTHCNTRHGAYNVKWSIPVYKAQNFFDSGNFYISASAMLAVLGHAFPVWLNFSEGKGDANKFGDSDST